MMLSLPWLVAVLKAIAWSSVAIALFCLGLALVLPKTPKRKAIWFVVVLVVICAPLVALQLSSMRHEAERREAAAAYQARLKPALALFEQRCKQSGEKIHRTVDDVEGVVWMRWREAAAVNDDDQYKLDDPYGRDCHDETCMEFLLRITEGQELNPESAAHFRDGYRFVEAQDPRNGVWYRYTYAMKLRPTWTEEDVRADEAKTGKRIDPSVYTPTLQKMAIEHPSARYGITWEDLSTRRDRDYWIAGGAVRIIDLQTNEVIAEHIGYMIDKGFGSKGAGNAVRSPWRWAIYSACPAYPKNRSNAPLKIGRTPLFAWRVLKPMKEN